METETACESYDWHGTTYTVSGEYTYAYTNADGCASVDTLKLTVNYGTHNVETETACESYDWHGTTYTVSGEYTYAYTNADGCASVDTLILTVHPQASLTVTNAEQEIEYGQNIIPAVITNTNSTVSINPDPNSANWPAGFSYSNQTLISDIPVVGVYNFTVSATNEFGCNAEDVAVKVTVTQNTTALTIASSDGNWTYDGNTHTSHSYTVTYGGETYNVTVAEGESTATVTLPTRDVITFTPDANASITHVSDGNVTNAFSYTITNSDDVDMTDQYANLITAPGTLSMSKKRILISGEKFKNYDGEVLVANYDELAVTPPLCGTDHFISGTVTTESAEQGVYTCTDGQFNYVMDLAAIQTGFFIVNAQNDTVNDDYTPEFRVTLTIAPPAVTIDCGTPQTVVMRDCEENVNLVDLVAPELEVADGVDASIFTVTPSVASGLTSLTPGTYTVTWTVTDEAGSTLASCDQTVTIEYAPCEPVFYHGHTYPAVRIGSQCWLAENLRNEEDADGNPIVNYRAVNDDPATVEDYGYLYSWYSAVGVQENNNNDVPTTYTDECEGDYVRGICPENWGIPTRADVNALRAAVEDDASMLKDFNAQYWLPGANGANPNSRFNARAEGHYNSAAGRFEGVLLYAYFWEVESQPGASQVISAVISYYCDNVQEVLSSKADLRPVRCVRKVTTGM